ncbi:hypothetical protein P4K23_28145 [Bacillus cereus]|uniref:hypothetical protein n=1 Tax=Bacillus toyonensis TaxID=155322 RepID=UPI000BFB79CC|nr:hypothetical protein [Bacillus toyonensis]MEB9857249.1 hypothetical protein [Bacillus cereus]MEB9891876.1 hypothetical protein [Bacillus cereus]PHA86234.1 hypothetical protein COE77_17885 [Bacillus toyonensis]
MKKKKSKKYEYIFSISFISIFVLIVGTLIVGLYTEFKFVKYFVFAILINGAITNESHKKYKAHLELSK